MNFLFDLIPTFIVLGLLILIHEWGHFIACRFSGVKVEKFSIGFGPELIRIRGKETRYAISLIPFGGFVKPAGESVSELGEGGLQPGDYLAASVFKRIIIVIAGVAMNYLLSFLLFSAIFLMGRPVPLAQIGGFVSGYPAATSGLVKGDRVISVGGTPVSSWSELTDQLSQISSKEVTLEIQRASRIERIHLPTRIEEVRDIFGETHRLARVGILPDLEAFKIEKLPFFPAVREAFRTEVHLTALTYKALFYLGTGQLSLKTVSGPLGIIAMTGTAAKMGIVSLLHLTAILGISLAVINLLPIPALDGGHLFFLLIEAARGKSVSLKLQERATQVGFALLMVLMILVFYNDLINLQVFDRVKQVFGH